MTVCACVPDLECPRGIATGTMTELRTSPWKRRRLRTTDLQGAACRFQLPETPLSCYRSPPALAQAISRERVQSASSGTWGVVNTKQAVRTGVEYQGWEGVGELTRGAGRLPFSSSHHEVTVAGTTKPLALTNSRLASICACTVASEKSNG